MQPLLLESAARAALIAAATAVVLFAVRVRSPRARHAAWLGVVLWMLLLPVSLWLLPRAPMRVLPASTPAAARAIAKTYVSVPAYPTVQLVTLLPDRPAASPWNPLLLIYAIGAAVLLARLATGILHAHALMRAAQPRDGHWISASCVAPVTVGWIRPRVILPESWNEWTPAKLAAVLAHEREHARRRDPLLQFAALLNRAVFWFHPLAWWLEARLSALAEESCDAAAIRDGHDPHDYSQYLLDIARSVEQSGTRLQVLGMAMPGSALPGRIRRILSAGPAPPLSRARAIFASVTCLLLSVLFAAGALAHKAPPQVRAFPVLLSAAIETPAAVASPVPSPTPAPAIVPPLPPQAVRSSAGRLLALYFHLPAMDSTEEQRAVKAATRFVSNNLQPTDRVSVMMCCAIRVIQDFTTNRDLVLQALNQLPDTVTAQQDPARQLAGLQSAVNMLSTIQDKKALIYFTRQTSFSHEDIQPLVNSAIRANVAFYFIDVSGNQQEPVRAPVAQFEAASVKPAAPAAPGTQHGIWSPDPARVTGRSTTLAEIIRYAYNIRPYQLSAPAWLDDERYDLAAKAPGSASPADLRLMTQALLAERFHLAVHHDTKEITFLEMTVAKGGPKMPPAGDSSGVQSPPAGEYTSVHVATAEGFARSLSNSHPNDPPIVDQTGLTGMYRFVLSLDPGTDLASALNEQLGLKLSPRKKASEILVVDHAEKTPVEN